MEYGGHIIVRRWNTVPTLLLGDTVEYCGHMIVNVRPYEGIYFHMFFYTVYGEMATIIKFTLY